MAVKGSVYVNGENLDELYELPEGFAEDNDDFNRELESATTV